MLKLEVEGPSKYPNLHRFKIPPLCYLRGGSKLAPWWNIPLHHRPSCPLLLPVSGCAKAYVDMKVWWMMLSQKASVQKCSLLQPVAKFSFIQTLLIVAEPNCIACTWLLELPSLYRACFHLLQQLSREPNAPWSCKSLPNLATLLEPSFPSTHSILGPNNIESDYHFTPNDKICSFCTIISP